MTELKVSDTDSFFLCTWRPSRSYAVKGNAVHSFRIIPYAWSWKVALQRPLPSCLRTLMLVSARLRHQIRSLGFLSKCPHSYRGCRCPSSPHSHQDSGIPPNESAPPSLLARLGIRNAAERKGTHFSEMISFVLRYAPDYLVSVSSPPISEIGGRATDAIFSATKTSAASRC